MEKVNQQLVSVGLKPITLHSALYFYMPLKGSCSYVILGAQMLSPEMFDNINFILVPRYLSLTNACLVNSLIGAGLYMYSRKHLKTTNETCKVTYSAFGSAMFNLGSVLGWALCRSSLVGDDMSSSASGSFTRAFIGAASAVCAIKIAHCYLKEVDGGNKVSKIE